jgi:hypothetical protein
VEWSITVHAQRGYNTTGMEWINAQERTATLGRQLFRSLKAAQQQEPPELTDLGSPATEKFTRRTVVVYKSESADRHLGNGQDWTREGREFVERAHKVRTISYCIRNRKVGVKRTFFKNSPNTLIANDIEFDAS